MHRTIVWLSLLLAFSASAHHSLTGYYDAARTLTITGTVTKLQFTNPHVHIFISVVDAANGATTEWDMEFTSPNFFIRKGFDARFVKRGDRVSATGFPGRIIVSKLRPTELVLANGQRVETRVVNPTQLGDEKE